MLQCISSHTPCCVSGQIPKIIDTKKETILYYCLVLGVSWLGRPPEWSVASLRKPLRYVPAAAGGDSPYRPFPRRQQKGRSRLLCQLVKLQPGHNTSHLHLLSLLREMHLYQY